MQSISNTELERRAQGTLEVNVVNDSFWWTKKAKARRAARKKSKAKGGPKGFGVLLLLPYTKAMKRALAEHGITKANGKLEKGLGNLARQFHRVIIEKTHNRFEGGHVNMLNVYTTNNALGATISAIVQAILTWFKRKEDDFKRNQPMQDWEKKVVQVGQQVDEDYRDLKRDAVGNEIGSFLVQNGPLLIGGAVALFALKKFKIL